MAGPSTYAVVGDAQLVGGLGILNGGDDEIVSDARFNTSLEGFVGHYFGDAELSYGEVNGGNDVITGSNQVFASEHMVGDVYRQRDGKTLGGDDQIIGHKGQDTISGDVFYLSSGEFAGGADIISGGNDADLISGDVLACRETGMGKVFLKITGGHDTIDGGAGDDYITGDIFQPLDLAPDEDFIAGSDTLLGGAGDDTIYGDVMSFFEALVDVGGDDRIDGGLGNDLLDGGKGEDTLFFAIKGAAVTVDLSGASAIGQGTDYVVGFERVEGTNRADKITGNDFDKDLIGLAGDDVLTGLGGIDFLAGESGSVKLYGGDDFDVFHTGDDNADDLFNGGKGTDAINARTITSGVTVTFSKANTGVISSATSGTDSFKSIGSFDLSGQGDIVGAGAGSNVYELDGGNDIADGGGGNDTLEGEDGDDRLNGGLGNDELSGGAGIDTFVFDTALDGVNNVDTVFDYSLAGDKPIELDDGVFTGLALGALGKAAFRSGAGVVAAADASDRIVYDTNTGEIYFDADGVNGVGAVKFAVFLGLPQLAAINFMVI